MNPENTALYTERALVLQKREAYIRGRHESLTSGPITASERRDYGLAAARIFPLPKVEKPRIVTDRNGIQWCFGHGHESLLPRADCLLMANWPGSNGWKNDCAPGYPSITLKIREDLAPLFTDPTEWVEDTE